MLPSAGQVRCGGAAPVQGTACGVRPARTVDACATAPSAAAFR